MSKPIRLSHEDADKELLRVRESFATSGLQLHPVLYATPTHFGIVALEPGSLSGYDVLTDGTIALKTHTYSSNSHGALCRVE